MTNQDISRVIKRKYRQLLKRMIEKKQSIECALDMLEKLKTSKEYELNNYKLSIKEYQELSERLDMYVTRIEELKEECAVTEKVIQTIQTSINITELLEEFTNEDY